MVKRLDINKPPFAGERVGRASSDASPWGPPVGIVPPAPALPASLDPNNRRKTYGRGSGPVAVTPWTLATETEHGQQAALFCWAACAARLGFLAANEPACYGSLGRASETYNVQEIWIDDRHIPVAPVPALRWLAAIPNGGQRDKATAGRLKAEGVKAGVPDILLPVPVPISGGARMLHGFWIELKREIYRNRKDGGRSEEQLDWADYLRDAGYAYSLCFGWEEARDAIRLYLEG